MISLKNAADIERMRCSGRIAADIRDRLAARVAPGVTTAEIDAWAMELFAEYGAESAFYGYRGYPGHVCVSVNDEVVHGIPGRRTIRLGDIVGLDVGVRCGGYYGDTTVTVMVGVEDLDVMRLVATAEAALAAGIDAARPGRHLSDVSHAIETVVESAGFSVVREFVGHGIGRSLHEDPQIPNFGAPGRGPVLKAGMTLAIEPMVNMGSAGVQVQSDGWTVLTEDRKPSAHAEHTILILDNAPAEVLTRADESAK